MQTGRSMKCSLSRLPEPAPRSRLIRSICRINQRWSEFDTQQLSLQRAAGVAQASLCSRSPPCHFLEGAEQKRLAFIYLTFDLY